MRSALLFAVVTIAVGAAGSLVLIAAEVLRNLRYERQWERHIDTALRVTR
jgi:hypothetical protein